MAFSRGEVTKSGHYEGGSDRVTAPIVANEKYR